MSWNARFASDDYHYGTEPSAFVVAQAWRLVPHSAVLSVAEGEGRNAVWLAGQGHTVHAVDGAPNALAKARRLAEARGVPVTTEEADLSAWHWPEARYDAVLGNFIQFAPPALRDALFAGMARALKPSGLMLLHGFAPRQLANSSGGPPVAENLWTLDLLRAAFAGWHVLHQADYNAVLDEGPGHSGAAALIDFVAQKPRL